MELICRQIQTIEERLKENFISGDEQSIDQYLMSGAPSRALLCICPAVTIWVASEAARDSAILKERRKAREERNLVAPKGKAKPG